MHSDRLWMPFHFVNANSFRVMKPMNKAFVREPDADVRVLCPKCGSPGRAVENGPIEVYVRPESRAQLLNAAWCCGNAACSVVYFNMFEQFVRAADLLASVYPYDLNAPICACFGFTYGDVDDDARDPQPLRIRALLAKSKSVDARCQSFAVDGQCCMREIQRLYRQLRSENHFP